LLLKAFLGTFKIQGCERADLQRLVFKNTKNVMKQQALPSYCGDMSLGKGVLNLIWKHPVDCK